MSTPDTSELRCVARTQNGRQCRIHAVQGQEFCLVHGANQKTLKQAQDTLNGLSILAVNVYEKALTQTDEKCSLCGHGYITSNKLKAAAAVLDRVGMGPELNLHHSGTVGVQVEMSVIVQRMTDEEFFAVDAIMQKVMARIEADKALVEGGGE